MKFLFSSLLLLTSISSFAQILNKVDFVLLSNYAEFQGIDKSEVAKVEITGTRYDRWIKEKLMLLCSVKTDKELLIAFYDGQVIIHHPKADKPVATCDSTGCQTAKFEDLASEATKAISSVDLGEHKANNYGIFSSSYYEIFKNNYSRLGLPLISEIPYVTIYDPKIHTKLPRTNTFACWMQNLDDQIVSP